MTERVRIPWFLSIVAVAMIVLAGACSGGDDGDGASPTSDASGSQSDSTATSDAGGDDTPAPGADTATPEPTATEESDGGMSGDVAKQMADILKNADEVEYVITYRTDAEFEGGTYVGLTTMYEGGERSRVDFDVEVAGQKIQGASINTPEKNYFCSDQDGEQTCFEFPAGQESIFPDPSEQFTDTVDAFSDEADQYSINAAPGRTIAGQKGTCFEVGGPEGTGTVCFSEDGILLLMELESPEGKFSLEATEYRLGVTDEDFEPPYPVTSFGA